MPKEEVAPSRGSASAGTPAEAAGGDESLESLRRRLIAAVRRTCPAYVAEHTEDIVQTVMTRLVVFRRGSEGDWRFSSTYLLKAAHGVAVDEMRRLCRRRENPVEDPAALDEMVGPTPGPEREAAASEIGRGIQDCLSRLVRPRRLAVILYLEGCSVSEAAGHLNWSVKKTENLVYRGLADLRVCLRSKGLGP